MFYSSKCVKISKWSRLCSPLLFYKETVLYLTESSFAYFGKYPLMDVVLLYELNLGRTDI